VLTARFDQLAFHRVVPAIYAVETVLFLLLAFVAEQFVLAIVLVLALADGTLAITARGLLRGAVAATLKPHDQLRAGNGLVNVGFAVSSVGGAALGGLIIAVSSVQVALLIDAATFALAGVVLLGARRVNAVAPSEGRSPLLRLREGLGHATRAPFVRLLFAGQAVALVFFTLVIPIEVIYAKESLGAGDAGFGLLLASWGAGIVVGSLVFVSVRSASAARLALLGAAAVGVAYLGMAAAETLLVACALSVLGGAGNGVQWVAVVTLVQEHTSLSLQARAAGLMESLAAAMPGFGFVLGGGLTAVSSPRVAYAVAGVGVLALVCLAPFLAWRMGELGGRPRSAA